MKLLNSDSPIAIAIIALLAVAVAAYLVSAAGVPWPSTPIGWIAWGLVVMLILGWLASQMRGATKR